MRTPLPPEDAPTPDEGQSVAPGLMLAAPNLVDPNFAGAVVLMAQHSSEGALGFVINHPATVNLGEVLNTIDPELAEAAASRGLADAPVLVGGPVQRSALWLLFRRKPGEEIDHMLMVDDELTLGATPQLLAELISGERPGPFHVILGYAGWGPGQIEGETGEGSWVPISLEPDIIFDVRSEERWSAAFKSLGAAPGAFVMAGPGLA